MNLSPLRDFLMKDTPAENKKVKKRSQGKMAAYARIYGIRIYSYNQIRGNTENYIRLSADCYILEADYDYLEELLDKEN